MSEIEELREQIAALQADFAKMQADLDRLSRPGWVIMGMGKPTIEMPLLEPPNWFKRMVYRDTMPTDGKPARKYGTWHDPSE